jgi:hypothetical protein
MTDAKTFRRETRKREIRAARVANAEDAIGDLEPGAEIFILTFGQFSLIDAVTALLKKTGPADVVLSTWTAGHADLTTAGDLLERAEIKSFRLIVDSSFINRKPDWCRRMMTIFGPECVRTWRGHAKFAVIRNDRWTLAVRTSMNLNTNPRLENLEISDDPEFAAFLWDVVDTFFAEQSEGVGLEFEDWRLPELAGLETIDKPAVRTGKASAGARPRTERRLG